MTKIKDIIDYLEGIAPGSWQESYDNAGLITGNSNEEVKGILLCLDALEAVIDEAIEKGYNLVIAHHPIVFRGLKKINGKNYIERTVIKAIKHDIAIYAIHTNLDNVYNGVNHQIANRLGLVQQNVLLPKKETLQKLVAFVPTEHTQAVLDALYQAGAGQIGEYKNCSFSIRGTGTFLPGDSANPYIGEAGKAEEVEEDRIEVIFSTASSRNILNALFDAHPYESVAYYLQNVANENQEVGSGMIGKLETPLSPQEFLNYVKEKMELKCIRHTALLNNKIETVALCGGAGSFLLGHAIARGADAFVSADFKYHEFFDADGKIVIMDIGHYESEVFTKDLIYEFINKKFTNIAVDFTQQVTNPISYY